MRKYSLLLLFWFCAFAGYAQEKIPAFKLLDKPKKALQKESPRLVFGFDNGYVRPKWKPGQLGPCERVEVTFYKDPPKMTIDTTFINLIDAPPGKMKFHGERFGGDGNQYVFSLVTPENLYAIVCTGKYGEALESILISVQNKD